MVQDIPVIYLLLHDRSTNADNAEKAQKLLQVC
jgi:hypothetical protein